MRTGPVGRLRHRLILVAVFVAGVTWARSAAAQERFVHKSCRAAFPRSVLARHEGADLKRPTVDVSLDVSLAAKYAPEYFFAPNERYFPTIPFFQAFDGVNQFGGETDLKELKEILPGVKLSSKDGRQVARVAWNPIDSLYRDAREGRDSIPAAVFYWVEQWEYGCPEVQGLWEYLRSDEQAWRRSGIDTVFANMDSLQQGFVAVEYYLYYIQDFGLEGHQYDVEFVYVLLPDTTIAVLPDTIRNNIRPNVLKQALVKPEDFRVVVGAGHTDFIPSNVLVLMGDQAQAKPPRQRPRIIVELGDHSSATDLPPYRRFRPGWDVNWQPQQVWGVRDGQATHGLGYMGQYDIGMTFPRDTGSARTFLPPGTVSETGDSKRTQSYSLIPVESLWRLFDDLCAFDSVTSSAPCAGGDIGASQFDTLKNYPAAGITLQVPKTADPACISAYDSRWDKRFLGDFKRIVEHAESDNAGSWNFSQFARLDQGERAAAVCTMRFWLSDLVAFLPVTKDGEFDRWKARDIHTEKIQIWNNSHFLRHSFRVFKTHLFRPVANQGGQILWGALTQPRLVFAYFPEGRYRLHFGSVIPVVRKLPIQLPGILEIQAGIYGELFAGLAHPKRMRFSMAGVYERYYARPVSWFLELAAVANRGSMDQETSVAAIDGESITTIRERSVWTIGGGISFLISPIYKTRIRVGPRIDLGGPLQPGRAIDWGIHISFVQ